MRDWRSYAEIAITMFVIADPIGTIPIFITLTVEQTPAERKATAMNASVTVAAVLVVSVFIGEPLLHFFGISLPAFSVGGGILLLLMAVAMLQARPSRTRRTPEETQEATEKEDVGVVPLALPLVAGPGAISTIIIYSHRAAGWFDTLFLVLIGLFVGVSLWIALRLADPIRGFLGRTGINIITRLLGLILAAIAVEFITRGLAQLLPGLAIPK